MLNYFVYKNGLGNFWSRLASAHGVLYVGFDNSFGKDPQPTPTNLGAAHKDLSHILFVTHPDNRGRFLLLTFERTVLRVWRVTGPIRVATIDELATAATIRPRRRPETYQRYFTAPKGQDTPSPFRVLPVSLVTEVPRADLYTSVDSLAVYQSLNRGTCRPLWRSTGPTGAKFPSFIVAQTAIPGCARGDLGKETRFAAFSRLYLNELLYRDDKVVPGPRLGEFVVDPDSATKVVMATLNPILVETAALAFVQDLGLTPDIGVGKGKDVIDVRARAVGPDGSFNAMIADRTWATLQAMNLKTADGDHTLRDKLLQRGVLDIQCKAADREVNAKGVLYFGFRGRGHDGLASILLNDLDTLLGGGSWPNLRRFLAMQARILLGEWSRPSATPLKNELPGGTDAP